MGDHAVLGGGSAYHQFTRVGEGAIVGGLSRITLDIPPFVMAAERDEVAGLNLVGLRRRGVPREAIKEIKEAFRLVYFQQGKHPRRRGTGACERALQVRRDACASSSSSPRASAGSPAQGASGVPAPRRTRIDRLATLERADRHHLRGPGRDRSGDHRGVAGGQPGGGAGNRGHRPRPLARDAPRRDRGRSPSGCEDYRGRAGAADGEGSLVAWAALERAAELCASRGFSPGS